MSELIKKPQVEWDPFRTMREMLRWDPFREMTPVFPEYEKVTFAFNPSFEVTENKDAFVFKADLPGVKLEDLEITTTGNRLQIAGKREYEQEANNDKVYTWERQYGTFTRTFTLPDGVDLEHAKSSLEKGVLTLVIPKIPAAIPKKIAIGTGATKS